MTREPSDSIVTDLKALRLHGMASTWADLVEQNNGELEASHWLLEQMLRAETTERAARSVGHQMASAKFPVPRDLAGFDFEASPVDRVAAVCRRFTCLPRQTVVRAGLTHMALGPQGGRWPVFVAGRVPIAASG